MFGFSSDVTKDDILSLHPGKDGGRNSRLPCIGGMVHGVSVLETVVMAYHLYHHLFYSYLLLFYSYLQRYITLL
jgi:hypothetical protein